MIKINLLPDQRAKIRKEAKKISVSNLATISAFIAVFLILGLFWQTLSNDIELLVIEKQQLKGNLKKIKKVVEEVKDFEKRKKILNEKVGLIDSLRKRQLLPVHLLDEVSQYLPKKAWLVKLNENNSNVTLEGRAISNTDIVEFSSGLTSSDYIKNVNIVETVQRIEKGTPIYFFKLKFHIGIP